MLINLEYFDYDTALVTSEFDHLNVLSIKALFLDVVGIGAL